MIYQLMSTLDRLPRSKTAIRLRWISRQRLTPTQYLAQIDGDKYITLCPAEQDKGERCYLEKI